MKKPGLIALFALLAGGIALAETPNGELRIRQALADSAAIASSSGTAVSPAELGTWNDVLSSSLFLLFRRTELYRGPLSFTVTESPDAGAELVSGGAFRVTSALLDSVDEEFFAKLSATPGRPRDMDEMRERLILPYLAFEASRFALDQRYEAASARFDENPAEAQTLPWAALTAISEDQTYRADRMALALLSAAGYEASAYTEWLASLDSRARSGNPGNHLKYLSEYPAPSLRLARVRSQTENVAAEAAAVRTVIRALRTGQGADEIRDALAGLNERYPGSPWFLRLKAFAAHLRWLSASDPGRLAFATVLPFAREGQAEFERLAPLIADGESVPATSALSSNPDWAAACAAYEGLSVKYSDPQAASAYATLLAYSNDPALLARAERLAETAAAAEASEKGRENSFAARANRATVTLLSGKDPLRASFILEGLIGDYSVDYRTAPRGSAGAVPSGVPGDTRVLLLNAILAAKRNGDRATALRSRLMDLAAPKAIGGMSIRGLTNGDDADAVLDKWGNPAEIVYTLDSETWYYPALSASVTLSPPQGGNEGIIRSVSMGALSPVSPGGGVRIRDTRSQFESVFGKSAWISGDREVYLVNGNRISVLYLGGEGSDRLMARIREITVEFAKIEP